jgi:hypothetical protein
MGNAATNGDAEYLSQAVEKEEAIKTGKEQPD